MSGGGTWKLGQTPWTATSETTPTIQVTTSPPMRSSGYVRIAALDSELCKKCGACNHGRAVNVWRVADERGAVFQCDVCAYEWPVK